MAKPKHIFNLKSTHNSNKFMVKNHLLICKRKGNVSVNAHFPNNLYRRASTNCFLHSDTDKL